MFVIKCDDGNRKEYARGQEGAILLFEDRSEAEEEIKNRQAEIKMFFPKMRIDFKICEIEFEEL